MNVLLLDGFQSPFFQVGFPRRAERRVRDAEVELAARVSVLADGAAIGKAVAHHSVMDIREGGAIATEHEIRLTGGKGLRLELLSEEAGFEAASLLIGYFCKAFLHNAQDAARTAGTVVDVVSAVL